MVPLALAFVAAVTAHPAMTSARGAAEPGNRTPGQRVEITVTTNEVVVDYFVEIAAMRVYAEAREEGGGEDYASRRAEELRTGLRARWDGDDLPLQPLPVPAPARTAEQGFVEFHVSARAPLPASSGTLRVEMGNFPDEPSYMAASVQVAGNIVVTESDLARASEGRLRENKHGAWRRDETARVATISFRPARPWEAGETAMLPERLEGVLTLPWRYKAGGAALAGVAILWTARHRRRRRSG